MDKILILAILCGICFGIWQKSFNAFSFMTVLLIFIALLRGKV